MSSYSDVIGKMGVTYHAAGYINQCNNGIHDERDLSLNQSEEFAGDTNECSYKRQTPYEGCIAEGYG